MLVDLSLPDATGLEALEQVLAMAPHAAVLVLTGLRDAHVGVAAVAAGAQDYLVKQDVDARLLARAIRYAIERKRADLAQRRLVEAELLPRRTPGWSAACCRSPLLHTERAGAPRPLPAGPPGALLAGDFFDTVQTPDGAVHVRGRRRLRARPRRGRARRGAAHRLAHAGAGRADRRRLLRTLDAVLRAERKSAEIFTTLCIATIDPDLPRPDARGRPSAAGADPRRRVERGPGHPSGPPLGIFPDVEWPASTCRSATTGRCCSTPTA